MVITRWQPYRNNALQNRLNTLFGEFNESDSQLTTAAFVPAVDVSWLFVGTNLRSSRSRRCSRRRTRAAELGNPEVQPVHLLLALIEDREGVIPSVLEKIGVPTERLEHDLHQIEEKLPRVAGARSQPGLSQALNKALEQAFARLRTSRTNTSRPSTLLLGAAT
jgi:hypothetical protein